MPSKPTLDDTNRDSEPIADWEVIEPDLADSELKAQGEFDSNDIVHREVERSLAPATEAKAKQSEDQSCHISEVTTKEQEILVFPVKDVGNDGGNDEKEQPYTAFSNKQVILIFIIIVYIGFLGPLSGNIYIPALPIMQNVFGLSTTAINATVSVFMAVFAVGPLIWASFADFGGRKILYMISLLLTVIVNILLAAVPVNTGALFFLRIMQAFASSSVMALGAGTVSDIKPPRVRGKAIAYFMLGPNMGPILAPIIAGLILMNGSYWRWLFGFTCILSGIGLFVVIFFLPETLRCVVGNGDPKWVDEELKKPDSWTNGFSKAGIRIFSDIGFLKPVSQAPEFLELYPRPPKPSLTVYWSLVKFPPVLLCSITTAILFAAYYAFSVTFSHFLREKYHLTNLQIGACYVCPGLALLLGSVTGGHLSDYFRHVWLKSHPGESFPGEKRLLLQIWGLLLNICGCIGYGWSIQFQYHLAVVLVFSFFTAFGMTWCSNTSMTYLTECIPRRAAGTVAVGSFFRNLAAGISSVIIMKLCDEMGVGWCFTGLAFCDLASLAGIVYLITNGRKWGPAIH
ncbi:LANO_0E08196g1_1 [Lachancea nothofagi CBS 11611]|uniref:LANO_0E08196g1_1 n=1 Tax=Lachancea nothofagi CBS 11611 TaxID=1266666 RepID=A0A1G4JUX7_9SACH|nr:LANO_0E08196g1_1 [Lachancea nothofagi CBS 11611]